MNKNILNKLSHYMFDDKLIMKFVNNKTIHLDKKQQQSNKNIVEDNKLYIPSNNDSLFWCYFIIKYGFFNYDLINKSEFIEEKKEKIKIIEKIRSNKDIIKSRKWKLNALEENLVEDKPLLLSTFLCCCFLHNINIVIKKDNCIYSQIIDNSKNITLIEYDSNTKKFGLYLKENKKDIIEKYLKDLFIITNINKKIQAQSNYKVKEIKEICNKLQISLVNTIGKPYKKSELYEMVKFKLN
jgi:hypothetical protein